MPPRLAAAIARGLSADLRTEHPRHDDGELLSFVPTLSSGMSPILAHVTKKVRSTFRIAELTQKELF